MTWKVIKTKTEYNRAIKRLIEIFHVDEKSAEGDERDLLLVLVNDYERKNIQLPAVDALEAIKLKMAEKGLKPKDMHSVIGSKGHVSDVLSGKRGITLEMARRIKNALQLPAEVFFS